jgi:hypothetical protein
MRREGLRRNSEFLHRTIAKSHSVRSVDESAISHPAIHSENSFARLTPPLPGGEQMGETMDARIAPQRDADADKVRSFIAQYVGVDAKEVTDETILVLTGSISLS